MRFLIPLLFGLLLGRQPALAQPLPPGAPAVVITEIMYDLPGTDESLEFIEVRNPSDTNERGLGGYRFAEGIEFSFPSNLVAQPHQFFIVAKDSVAFENAFGVSAFQWTSGDLSDTGERIVLRNNFNAVSDSLTYSNAPPWPMAGAETGASIVHCVDSTAGWNPMNWTAATNSTGIMVNGVELHANPGEECSIDNSIHNLAENGFLIAPNPNTGTFRLQLAGQTQGNLQLDILTLSGQLVYSVPQNGDRTISIQLPAGIYLARLSRESATSYQRLVIVN